jgi:superfamily II DNA or RNA helicase/HKD family nuclease
VTNASVWESQLAGDVRYGFLDKNIESRRHNNPEIILNGTSASVLRTLREEITKCQSFTFSVAFVSPRAIALLKQEFVEFQGNGRIITSDYLGFNSPSAFEELKNLARLGIDVRIHASAAFHPKGYIFEHHNSVTAMMGSSNLTETAIVSNHEWNLKVSASGDSDLAKQLSGLVQGQLTESEPLTRAWIDDYTSRYIPPTSRPRRPKKPEAAGVPKPGGLELGVPVNGLEPSIHPNSMQEDALSAIEAVRQQGKQKALVISATGTGKTILSALHVRAVNPDRFLFIVHREQIIDRTLMEYQRVLREQPGSFGKLTGASKDVDSRYVFATIQTLSQGAVLGKIKADAFDYIVIDEAHRAGADSYQKVLRHFSPKFLMGMTATPERGDGKSVFELFDYNVAYEIRLNHALEAEMLSPFHYYGVADVVYDDGTRQSAEDNLRPLISETRVSHVVKAMETYGQAGVAPCGLIFCSGTEEARLLSQALNQQSLRGNVLRTVALTGKDSIEQRESVVASLENGELDYVLTVDIFNEGIDIPTLNQVIMLRQTQSSIVFVQQLGRGLRKATGKEYLVVIDFIGNYANNYMIPIALFGDDSLNKESLRKSLIAAEESGVLPGLSSVRFDKVAQERVLRSISTTTLDSMQRLKAAVEAMRDRVGGIPRLRDFARFESVDPVLLATKRENYPTLIRSILREGPEFSTIEHKVLGLLSHEVLTSKRHHEFLLMQDLLGSDRTTTTSLTQRAEQIGLTATDGQWQSAIDTLTLNGFSQADQTRYGNPVAARCSDGSVELSASFLDSYGNTHGFATEVDDILDTGLQLVIKKYPKGSSFLSGAQYSRKEAMRLLSLPRTWTSTVYGYKVDLESKTCPIFVTLHKADDVLASIAYQDELIDRTRMRWFTRSRRTLASAEVQAIVSNSVDLHVFVKKDDAEGTGFYYLGQATAQDAVQSTMPDKDGKELDVVHMDLRFDVPIESALYDYFHPSVSLT